MLLKKIRYNNFRPFLGRQEVDFNPNNENRDANVIVLLGENTFGKSTFVLSFIWCLYGESRFDNSDEILNKKIEEKMSFGQQETAWVELEFEDGGMTYCLKRSQLFTKGQNGKLLSNNPEAILNVVTSDGETVRPGRDGKSSASLSQGEINEIIKTILPLDLSAFFFFEGEKNNAIKKKDLGKSVRTLLGLEAFDNMKKHLYGSQNRSKSVMNYFLSKQSSESDTEAQAEFNKKLKCEEDLRKVLARIEAIDLDISKYEQSIEQINETLRQAAPSKELQKRRDAIKRELAEQEDLLKKNNNKLMNLFSKNSLPLFVIPFLSKTTERLNEMDVADKGIKGIEAAAIHELLGRGVCLCGKNLKPGTSAYKTVEKYIDYIPPKSVGTLVRDMLETIDANGDKSQQFVNDFEDMYRDIQINKTKIDALEREEKEKLAEIAKIGNVDTSSAESNLYDYRNRIYALREERDRKISEAGSKKTEIETSQKRFNALKSKSNEAKRYVTYYRYAEALYNWVVINYSKKEDDMRSRLSKYIAELFNNMYTGHREIIIDEQYNITARAQDGNTALTGGLSVIKYFAFVGGLVKLAYEVMQERNSDDNAQELGEQFPLVLDAAFSHADETHTMNIARELANASHQLIFAVMPKDWQYAKKGLVGKVGRVFELQKVDESEARIVEVK